MRLNNLGGFATFRGRFFFMGSDSLGDQNHPQLQKSEPFYPTFGNQHQAAKFANPPPKKKGEKNGDVWLPVARFLVAFLEMDVGGRKMKMRPFFYLPSEIQLPTRGLCPGKLVARKSRQNKAITPLANVKPR